MSKHHRFAELNEISLQRALSAIESDELFGAFVVEDLRQRRLPARIMRLRKEVHRLESELWVQYLPKLRALEAEAEQATIDAIERELADG